MNTIDEIRLERLKILINEYGGASKLEKIIDKSLPQISQWIKRTPDSKTGKPRAISTRTAREIEVKCNKPQGWMDAPVVANEIIQLKYNEVKLPLFGAALDKSDNPVIKSADIYENLKEVIIHGRVRWAWNGKKL